MLEKVLKARYSSGTLLLFDDVKLKEGEIVSLYLVEEEPPVDEKTIEESIRRSCGAWEGLVDPDELIEHIRQRRLIQTRPEPRL